jgi:DNA-directed RNA polymerase specialized sigma24 family protein
MKGWGCPPRDPRGDWFVEQQAIEAALARVTPVFQEPLVLWFFCDMSYNEIADTLQRPVNTVRTQLRRGKAELAQLLCGQAELAQLQKEPDVAPAVSNQPVSGSGYAKC